MSRINTTQHRPSDSQKSEFFGTPNSQMDQDDFDDEDDGRDFGEDSVEVEPPPAFFVRALYDYTSSDGTSMSFQQGAVIKVLSQEDTGWWDGLLENDERGWFPSNYVEVISEAETELMLAQLEGEGEGDEEAEDEEEEVSESMLDNTTASSSSRRKTNDYSGLGLGKDFDALRTLMTGSSPMPNTDAFEQLAEEGMRSTYTPSEGSTPTFSAELATSSNPRKQQQQRSDEIHSKGSLPSRGSNGLENGNSSKNSGLSVLNSTGSVAASSMSKGAVPPVSPTERSRAHTVSAGESSRRRAGAHDNRPRAVSDAETNEHNTKVASDSQDPQGERAENDFWVPRVTERGDIVYINTQTGQQVDEMPERMEARGGDISSTIPSEEEEEEEDDEEDRSGSENSRARSHRLAANPKPFYGRHTSTIVAQGSDRRGSAAPDRKVDNLVEEMPDPRTVPFPWIARTNLDERTFHYYNRQTHETRQSVNLMPWNERWDADDDTPDTSKLGPRKSRSATINSVATSNRDDEVDAASLTAFQDEKDAYELQRLVAPLQVSPLLPLMERAGDAISTLVTVASEPVASDGMSEQDRIALTQMADDEEMYCRLGQAMHNVVDCLRDLLYAAGSLCMMHTDLMMVSELSWLARDDAPMPVLVALQTAMSASYHRAVVEEVEAHVAASLQQAIPTLPTALHVVGKRMTATLSKVVLSTRSVIEQSFLNSIDRPLLSPVQLDRITTYRLRIRDECMELGRSLGAFGTETERARDRDVKAGWMRSIYGVLQSGKGTGGIGIDTLGGGAAAGWRGNGFVLPSAIEAATLRAEAMGTYQNPFELTKASRSALSTGKVALRRRPVEVMTRQHFEKFEGQLDSLGAKLASNEAKWRGRSGMNGDAGPAEHSQLLEERELLTLIGAILVEVEDLDLASSLDVDGAVIEKDAGEVNGTKRDEAAYVDTVKRARELLHQLTFCKQSLYDATSCLVMDLQDLVTEQNQNNDVEGYRNDVADTLASIESGCRQLKQVLGELVDVSEEQASSSVTGGRIGARSKVQGVDDVKLIARSGVSGVSTPGEEPRSILYLGPGLELPDGPPVSRGISDSNDGLRNRSMSVTTGGATSVKSRDSGGARSFMRKGDDEEDSLRSSQKGNSKIKRFFGDDAPTSVGSTRDTAASTLIDGDLSSIAPSTFRQAEEVPWFLEQDYSADDILLSPTGQVKGATLSAMMERLTMHNAFDSSFNTTFLMTYRSFSSTEALIELLWQRFCIKEPAGLTDEEREMWTSRKQMLIRFRTFNVLKTWLELHFYEGSDEIHLKRLEHFVLDGMGRSPSLASPGKQLLRLIERRSGKGEKIIKTPQAPGVPPPPILPKNFRKIKFLDIDPLEMARQLTLIDSRLYSRIKPVECLGKAWSRDDGAQVAKGIRDVISANNKVSGWVSEAILVQDDLKRRVAWVKQFVAIADRCYKLNNFSSMMAIYSGLNNASLNRLRRTWDAVNQRHLQMFERMKVILAPTKNFSQYREALRSSTPPCVPFLGVYLTDLTFIEDGNSDKLKTDERLINFGKRQMTADKIEEIMNYQRLPYNFAEVPSVQKFIEDNLIDSRRDDELFEQSLRLEPREREDEKIARLLQESGFL